MSKILLSILVTVTIYHADPRQTDSTPFITASGARIDSLNPGKHRWLAVSRDLERKGFVFGTCVLITGTNSSLDGEWEVKDRMNKRWRRRVDLLVDTTRTGGKWENIKLTLLNEKYQTKKHVNK